MGAELRGHDLVKVQGNERIDDDVTEENAEGNVVVDEHTARAGPVVAGDLHLLALGDGDALETPREGNGRQEGGQGAQSECGLVEREEGEEEDDSDETTGLAGGARLVEKGVQDEALPERNGKRTKELGNKKEEERRGGKGKPGREWR